MCGILGDINHSFDTMRFQLALSQLRHRGPFGEGLIKLPEGALGMTRLPMSSDKSVPLPVNILNASVAYNGEIYGTDMDIYSEVQVLLQGIYNRKLPDGMYAAAIWQPEEATLTLVRDRFGIKPLYYHYNAESGRLSFASELRALITLTDLRRADQDAIAEMVATGVTFEQRTLFSGIKMLAPGEVLHFYLSERGASLKCRELVPAELSHLNLNLEESLAKSIESCTDTFRSSALLISGGVDSTLINTWLPVNTAKFTLSLQGAEEEVTDWSTLRRVSLEEKDFMTLLRRSVVNYGSATRMSSLLMYQRLADAVGNEGFHSVLVGEGADELFHGYPRHLDLYQKDMMFTPDSFNHYWFGDYSTKSKILSPDRAAQLCRDLDRRAATELAGGIEQAIRHYDLIYSLEPLLRRADHLLMSRTIEARLPFLHYGIEQLAQQVVRIDKGQTKVALRQLLEARLPRTRLGPKRHFRIPFSQWPGAVVQMKTYLKKSLEALHKLGLVNLTPAIIDTMEEAQLFTLTTLSVWQHEFKVES